MWEGLLITTRVVRFTEIRELHSIVRYQASKHYFFVIKSLVVFVVHAGGYIVGMDQDFVEATTDNIDSSKQAMDFVITFKNMEDSLGCLLIILTGFR